MPDTLCSIGTFLVDSLSQDVAVDWQWLINGTQFSRESKPGEIAFDKVGRHEITQIIETESCRDTFVREVEFVAAPNFDIGDDLTVCEVSVLEVDIMQNNLQNYIWSDGVVGASRSIDKAGEYTAFAENRHCQVSASRRITFLEDRFSENPVPLGNDTTICWQIPLELNITNIEADSYRWLDGFSEPKRVIEQSGVYRAEVVIDNCVFQKSILVEAEDCAAKLYLPTAFSPNGDGLNDVLSIGAKHAEIQSIRVFNRWGTLLYEGTTAWDGMIGGKRAKTGLYIYKVEYIEDISDKLEQVVREVTLMR